jgi:hypothetical protein
MCAGVYLVHLTEKGGLIFDTVLDSTHAIHPERLKLKLAGYLNCLLYGLR